MASGGLDEYGLDDLVRARAPIDVFAVGTRVGVSADAPYLDSAYKLVAYGSRPVMKLSSGKVTAPGPKQVFRRPGHRDVLGLRGETPPPGGRSLLEAFMVHGRLEHEGGSLTDARQQLAADLADLPSEARRIRGPHAPRAVPSAALRDLTDEVRHCAEQDNL